jgi:hypothetical protein
MPFYPDKRGRYAGVFQANIPAGTPRGDNPVQRPEPVSKLASRSPREAFRVSTTEEPTLLQKQAEDEALKLRAEAEAQKGISSAAAEPSSGTGSDMTLDTSANGSTVSTL